MKHSKRALITGLLVWGIPFLIAMVIYPLRASNRSLFESIMPVVLVASCFLSLRIYTRQVKLVTVTDALALGIFWFVLNLFIDFGMFIVGPIRMTLFEYLSDIGSTYLIIPLMVVGLFLFEKRKKGPTWRMLI